MRERSGEELAHVVRRMDAQNVFVRGGLGREKIFGRGKAFRQETVVNQAIFLRGENVRAEVEIVGVVVDQLERQHDGGSLPRSPEQGKRGREPVVS